MTRRAGSADLPLHGGFVPKWLAERIAGIVLGDFAASRVKITITKLGVLREARRVGVVIERSASRSSFQ